MNWRSVMMAMVVLPLMVCGLILILRRVEGPATRALGVFLILAGLTMGPQIIGYAGAYSIWPWLTFCPLFFVDLWLGPLLIVHAHRLMRGGALGWKRWLFIPGIVQTLYYTGAFLLPGEGLFDTPAKWAFNNAVHEPVIVPIESLVGIGLLALAVGLLWRDRKVYMAYLDRTESAALDYDPVWLRNMIVAIIAAGAIYASVEITDLIVGLSYDAAFPFLVLITAIMLWAGLDAAWRLTTPFPKMSGALINREKGDKSGQPSGTDIGAPPPDLGARIQDGLTKERWYLEPRLSVRDVAARLGTNESYVSRATNRELGGSFNQIVNAARIEHAKARLKDSSDSILSIALESGFNSKATFNRVFREVSGQTPSQFRRDPSQNP